jgi:hypothetical protein
MAGYEGLTAEILDAGFWKRMKRYWIQVAGFRENVN